MATNFCIICGAKLGKDDNFCGNCGTKIDRTDIKQENHPLKSSHNSIEKEMNTKRVEKNEMDYGGYCGFNCKHYYEEIIDGGGGISGDYDDDMCGVEYYCNLGHPLVDGRFCEDYEWTVIMQLIFSISSNVT